MRVHCTCARVYFRLHVGTSGGGDVTAPSAHPVHDEDLVDVEFLLELLGGDGHRVEETETPVDKQTHVLIRTASPL